jgi:peroxiredoxin
VKRNLVILGVLAVVVGAMLYSGRFASHRPAGATLHGSAEQIKGKPAPEFELTDLDGKSVKLSDYRGKAVLLNFWATWCSPCKTEMPWFVDLQQRYGADGLQVIGVAMDDAGKDDIAKFAQEMKVNYTVLLGKNAVAEAYGGVEFLPTTFYIDRKGNIQERVFGLADRKEIEDNVKKALASSASQLALPAVNSVPEPKVASHEMVPVRARAASGVNR